MAVSYRQCGHRRK